MWPSRPRRRKSSRKLSVDENFIGPIKHRRGDVRADGLVFWGYHHGREQWCTKERVAVMRAESVKRSEAWVEKLRIEHPDKYRLYLDRAAEKAAAYRSVKARFGETEQQRADRIAAGRRRAARRKADETPEQAEERKAKRREYLKRVRSEGGPVHEARKAAFKRWLNKGDNRKKSVEKTAAWRKANRDYVRAKARERFQLNKPEILEQVKKYRRNRCARDPAFRILIALRSRLSAAMKGVRRSVHAQTLFGEGFKDRVLAELRGAMTPDNFGKMWQVDHVVPCTWFNLADEAQQRIAFHWSNLRPEYCHVNRAKGARCTEEDLDFVLRRCPEPHRAFLEKFRERARKCKPYRQADVHSTTAP